MNELDRKLEDFRQHINKEYLGHSTWHFLLRLIVALINEMRSK